MKPTNNPTLTGLPDDMIVRLTQQLAAKRIDWTELRDLLHLPSTDCDKALVIHEIKQLREQLDAAVEALRDLYENPSPKTARKAQSVLAEIEKK